MGYTFANCHCEPFQVSFKYSYHQLPPQSYTSQSISKKSFRGSTVKNTLNITLQPHRPWKGLRKGHWQMYGFRYMIFFTCSLFPQLMVSFPYCKYSHVPKEKPRTFIWHLKKFSYSFPYFYQKFHRTLIPTRTSPKLLAIFVWRSRFTLWNSMTVL